MKLFLQNNISSLSNIGFLVLIFTYPIANNVDKITKVSDSPVKVVNAIDNNKPLSNVKPNSIITKRYENFQNISVQLKNKK